MEYLQMTFICGIHVTNAARSSMNATITTNVRIVQSRSGGLAWNTATHSTTAAWDFAEQDRYDVELNMLYHKKN